MATDTLPASIANALPTSIKIMEHFAAIGKLLPALDKDLAKARKSGTPSLARSFVALHRMCERIEEIMKPLDGDDGIYKRVKTQDIPNLFEQEGIKNVPLAEGFRVGVSSRFFASIKPGQKDTAYDWLRNINLGDLIQPTINSGTLSSALKKELEDNNRDIPEELFTVAMVPNASVTKT